MAQQARKRNDDQGCERILREFGLQVDTICGLHAGNKMSPEEAFAKIATLYEVLDDAFQGDEPLVKDAASE